MSRMANNQACVESACFVVEFVVMSFALTRHLLEIPLRNVTVIIINRNKRKSSVEVARFGVSCT
jgi:hypothetical protein